MKKRLLIEGVSSNLGGIEVFVYNLIKKSYKKYDISVMLYKNTKMPYQEELEKLGCKFIYITHRKNGYLKHLNDLKKMYIKGHFDIIHINLVNYSPFERILLARRYSKSKIILHSHSSSLFNSNLKNKILHNIGKILVNNKNYCNISCGVDAGNFMFGKKSFSIIKNGINIDNFKYNEKNNISIRKELNLNNDDFILGHVGSLEEVKNQKFLIDVFDEIQKVNTNSKLIIIGEGSLKDNLINKIKSMNLNEKVFLLGKKMNVNEFYSVFNVYVMPSISEGISISLVEAQSNGLKCYTSDSVDKNSDVTNNVEFLSLNMEPKEWADFIMNNNKRDLKACDKIPAEYDMKNSYKILFSLYEGGND